MLLELLTDETIIINHESMSWEDAIALSAQPLLAQGQIKSEYITAMIDCVNKFGPYIVIAPRVALPHARPEKGALKMGLSLLINRAGINFSEDPEHQVNLVFALSATDSQAHIKALTELSEVLGDDAAISALIEANSAIAVQSVLTRYLEQ